MDAAYTPPGWYPSPDNPGLVRYWDGEMWTDSTRPTPHSTAATATFGGPDHFVQHSALVASELRDGEVIRLGYKATNTNTGRRQFVVATDQRVFVLRCKYFRRSNIKSVESMDYDEIDTVGTISFAGGKAGVVTSGNRSMNIPYHGGGAANIVAWVRVQIDTYDDVVDIRSLPKPQGLAVDTPDHEVNLRETTRTSTSGEMPTGLATEASPQLGVADEIRKLGELLNEGLLTQDEFTTQKQRLLGH